MDNRLHGIDIDDREVGTTDCPENKQKLEAWCEGLSTGYRWLRVNEFLHVYMSVSVGYPINMIGGGPSSEALAYVQHLPSGKFRALRSTANGNVIMPIPYGPAEEMIEGVEKYILAERLEKDNQGVNALG